jgi:hypothetical protein
MDKVNERLRKLNEKLKHASTPAHEKEAIKNTIKKIHQRYNSVGASSNGTAEVIKPKALKGKVNYYHSARIKKDRVVKQGLEFIVKKFSNHWDKSRNPKYAYTSHAIQSGIGFGSHAALKKYEDNIIKKLDTDSKFKKSKSFAAYYAKREKVNRRKEKNLDMPDHFLYSTIGGTAGTYASALTNLPSILGSENTDPKLYTTLAAMAASNLVGRNAGKLTNYGVGYLKQKRKSKR